MKREDAHREFTCLRGSVSILQPSLLGDRAAVKNESGNPVLEVTFKSASQLSRRTKVWKRSVEAFPRADAGWEEVSQIPR